MSTEDATRLYREGLITGAEIAMARGAVLVAKDIRDHANKLTSAPAAPSQEGR